jgi:crossover junction endodeoxyribonuclease RusA
MNELDVKELFVPGLPATAGSHKSFKGRIVHDSARTKTWMDAVAWCAIKKYGRCCCTTNPVGIRVVFCLPRPKGHLKKNGDLRPSAPPCHITRPDLDKMVRAVQDALTGVLYRDDNQVIRIEARKMYAPASEACGVHIWVKNGEE